MTLSQKLNVLIRRKGISKTDFASSVGITYRALANYVSGGRNPRKTILKKMAEELSTTSEFLTNDKLGLVLDSEERFLFNSASDEVSLNRAVALLREARVIFGDPKLNAEDKRTLYSCLTEVYFNK